MDKPSDRPVSFISFDVEALPGRASDGHLDRLIWGKVGEGEYGLRRISNILGQHRIKGNFLIDLSMCELYGKRAVERIMSFLMEEGHEVHVHLHPECLLQIWQIELGWHGPIGMDRLDEALQDRLLEFAVSRYFDIVGRTPVVFRAGSLLFSDRTVAAAKRAGFRALSNFNADRHAASWEMSAEAWQDCPFSWENGVLEFPVDIAPEPLAISLLNYLGAFERVGVRKSIRTFNIVLHSTSLLQRSERGYFESFNPMHEQALHEICTHLNSYSSPSGYEQYLNCMPQLPRLRHSHCRVQPVPSLLPFDSIPQFVRNHGPRQACEGLDENIRGQSDLDHDAGNVAA